jgi:hypothetical protein
MVDGFISDVQHVGFLIFLKENEPQHTMLLRNIADQCTWHGN